MTAPAPETVPSTASEHLSIQPLPPEKKVSSPKHEEPAAPVLSQTSVDFSSWQDKFSKFAKSEKRCPTSPAPGIAQDRPDSSQPFDGVAEVQKFRVEWKQFLDVLLKKKYKVIVTHLRSCELTSFSHGILHMSSGKRFSYEELLHDAALLTRELEEFYGLPVKLHISYDETKDAGTREQTIFTLFRELSENNEIVKFLVREFGGELVY